MLKKLCIVLTVLQVYELDAMAIIARRLMAIQKTRLPYAVQMRRIHMNALLLQRNQDSIKEQLRKYEESLGIKELSLDEKIVALEKAHFKAHLTIHNPYIRVENLKKAGLAEQAQEMLDNHNCKAREAIKEMRKNLDILDVVVARASSPSDPQRKKRYMILHATRNIIKRLAAQYIKG